MQSIGSTLVAAHNGKESGQEIPHVHVHVIPRSKNDGAGPVFTVCLGLVHNNKRTNRAGIQCDTFSLERVQSFFSGNIIH